jgi:hypothetical protein
VAGLLLVGDVAADDGLFAWLAAKLDAVPGGGRRLFFASLDDPAQFDAGPRSLKQPFVVEDGRYVSARWPGDAELFAQRLAALLSAGPRPQPAAAIPRPAT